MGFDFVETGFTRPTWAVNALHLPVVQYLDGNVLKPSMSIRRPRRRRKNRVFYCVLVRGGYALVHGGL